MPICALDGCSTEAKLQCPTCLKLKITDSTITHFCSQDHFKKSWDTHKSVHTKARKIAQVFDPFPNYSYTGELRALYPLSAPRRVPEHITRPDYAESGRSKTEEAASRTKIDVLTEEEIEIMRKVCRLGREVLDIGGKAAKVGVTTDEIDRIVHEACVERGCYPSPLNYYYFPKSCCTSVNEVICHGIPDQRPLQDGDIVNIDISVYKYGFHSDLNETFLVGNVADASRKLVDVTRECLNKAIEMVKPGVAYRDLGAVIEEHANANGFSVVRTYCGHGVNKLFHCAPNVPHYAKNKAIGIMKPGHTFTIEPMISEGIFRDETWPDNWTAVTKDGKRSAQFEETILVTETGYDILTKSIE